MKSANIRLTGKRNRRTPAKSILQGTYLLGLEIKYLLDKKEVGAPMNEDDTFKLMKLLTCMADIKEVADKSYAEFEQQQEIYGQLSETDLLTERRKALEDEASSTEDDEPVQEED